VKTGRKTMNGITSKPTRLSKKCTLAFPLEVPWILGEGCREMLKDPRKPAEQYSCRNVARRQAQLLMN